MMTDERLAVIVAQCDAEYYVPSSFVYELSDEINRLKSENSELRERLAVFTEGMMSEKAISESMIALKEHKHSGRVIGDDWDATNEAIDYLRRIASANEVTNDKP